MQAGKEAGRVRLGIEALAKRGLGHAQAAAPLAVSGPRGVACAPVGLQRIVLLDLVCPCLPGPLSFLGTMHVSQNYLAIFA